MTIPIIGENKNPYIVVEMTPGLNPGTFDIKLDTQHFPNGLPLAVQCLLQAVMFLLPQTFQSVAAIPVQQVLHQQRAQNNEGTEPCPLH